MIERFREREENVKDLCVEISVNLCGSIVYLKFVVKLSCMDHQEKDGGGSEELFLWDCLEKYQKLGEIPPNFVSYDWLGVRDESVGEDVKWHLDTLSAEIVLFKEMLECEEDSKFVS